MSGETLLGTDTFRHLCRTCLTSLDLTCINDVEWEGVSLRKVLRKWISFEGIYERTMPQAICKSCIKRAYNFDYFEMQIKKSEELLKTSIMHSLMNAVEPTQTEPVIILEVKSEDEGDDLEDSQDIENNRDKVNRAIPSTSNIGTAPQNVKVLKKNQILVPRPGANQEKILKPLSKVPIHTSVVKIGSVRGVPAQVQDSDDKNPQITQNIKQITIPSKSINTAEKLPFKPRFLNVKPQDLQPLSQTAAASLSPVKSVQTSQVIGKILQIVPHAAHLFKPNQTATDKLVSPVVVQNNNLENIVSKAVVPDGFEKDQNERYLEELQQDKQEIKAIKTKMEAAIKHSNRVSELKHLRLEFQVLEQEGKIVSQLNENFIYFCGQCESGFHTNKELLSHKKISKHYKGGSIYSCPECKKRIRSHERFKYHMRIHNNERPFICPICDKGFKGLGDKSRHVQRVHRNQRPLQCHFCYRVFSKKEDREEHEKTHDKIEYVCTFCGQIFKIYMAFVAHEKRHKQETLRSKRPPLERRYTKTTSDKIQCLECQKLFETKDDFKAHYTDAHQIVFMCDVCSRECSTKQGLVNHKVSHSEERKFVCHICPQACKRKKDLTNHIERHLQKQTGIWQNCQYCDKAFRDKNGLRTHMRIHTNDPKYQCKICLRICTTKRNLDVHTRVHTGERSYECQECSKKFASSQNLKYHLRTHAGPPTLECPQCPTKFYQNYMRLKHLRKVHKMDTKKTSSEADNYSSEDTNDSMSQDEFIEMIKDEDSNSEN